MSLLQGTELYSTSVTPHNPNLQFDMQVATGLQQKYDEGYNRASILYGSIVNPNLSRLDTQQAKEEYLRKVDEDLRRVGKIDWSISENITAAQNLFKGMWTNKLLLKDAKWTQNFEKEISKAEGFKNCLDASKCGGQYWDEGLKYMNYKRQEFINSDSDAALMFDDVQYIPYNSVMDKALKIFKESGLSIKYDNVSEDGFIVTTKNGENLRSPLTLLFNETLAKDPRLMDMFKVKSYVDRKDWVNSKLQSGEYSNEQEANVNYLNSMNNLTIQNLNREAFNLGVDKTFLEEEIQNLEEMQMTEQFAEGSELHQKLLRLKDLKSNTDNALAVVEQLNTVAQSKNKAALNVMIDAFDNENAFNYFSREIKNAINVTMYKDYERTLEVNPYAMEQVKFSNKLKEMQIQHDYNVRMENIESANRFKLEQFKAEVNPNDGSGTDADKQEKIDAAQREITLFDQESERKINDAFRKQFPNASDQEVEDALKGRSSKQSHIDFAKELEYNRRSEKAKLKAKVNTAAVKGGQPIPYPEALMKNQLSAFEPDEFENAIDQTVDYLNINLNMSKEELYIKVAKKFVNPNSSNKQLSENIYDVINNK